MMVQAPTFCALNCYYNLDCRDNIYKPPAKEEKAKWNIRITVECQK